jgi:uncharacterized linocin/CFP29 family protein
MEPSPLSPNNHSCKRTPSVGSSTVARVRDDPPLYLIDRLEAPGEGILARQREAKSLVELRVPFELGRYAIDDVERGANDSDWQPLKDAAKRIAFAEDRVIFEGYSGGGIEGIRQGTSNPVASLPSNLVEYPNAIAEALSQLRIVGVNGPYSVVMGADAYTALSEASDHGYPVIQHIQRLVNEEIIWAPAIGELLSSPRAAATSAYTSVRTFRSGI